MHKFWSLVSTTILEGAMAIQVPFIIYWPLGVALEQLQFSFLHQIKIFTPLTCMHNLIGINACAGGQNWDGKSLKGPIEHIYTFDLIFFLNK